MIRPPLVGLVDAGLTESQLNWRFQCKTPVISLSAAARMKRLQAVERSALSVPSQLSFFSQISKDALCLYDAFLLIQELITFAIHTRLSF